MMLCRFLGPRPAIGYRGGAIGPVGLLRMILPSDDGDAKNCNDAQSDEQANAKSSSLLKVLTVLGSCRCEECE